jgi:hypothetical protein
MINNLQLTFSVCAACKKPIEGRAVSAIDKKWHPEHFVCAHCEKPFAGERFYENKGDMKCDLAASRLVFPGDKVFHLLVTSYFTSYLLLVTS